MGKRERARELVKSGERKRESGDFAGAETDLQEARRLYETLGDSRALAHVWGHLGLNSQLQGNLGEASERFGQGLLCALKAGDRGTVAIALRHLGKIWTLKVPDRDLGIFLLRASVLGAPGSRAHRVWFRHGLVGGYFRNGQTLKAFWQLLLSLLDLGLGWREEPDTLKKRVWLTGALLDLGRLPLVGAVFSQITLSLATRWSLEVRRQEALRALGRDS